MKREVNVPAAVPQPLQLRFIHKHISLGVKQRGEVGSQRFCCVYIWRRCCSRREGLD